MLRRGAVLLLIPENYSRFTITTSFRVQLRWYLYPGDHGQHCNGVFLYYVQYGEYCMDSQEVFMALPKKQLRTIAKFRYRRFAVCAVIALTVIFGILALGKYHDIRKYNEN